MLNITAAVKKAEGYEGKGDLLLLDPTSIVVDYNPRKVFDSKKLAELQAQVKVNGITEPLQVYLDKERGFILVSGERRLRVVLALRAAGMPFPTVPCQLVDAPDKASIIVRAILANEGEPLNQVELAEAYQEMVDLGYSAKQVAEMFGTSQQQLSQMLRLAALPDNVKQQVISGKINRTEAVEIARELNIKPKGKSAPKVVEATVESAEDSEEHEEDTAATEAEAKAIALAEEKAQQRANAKGAQKALSQVAKDEGVELTPDEKRLVGILAKHGVDGFIAMAQRACQLTASLKEDKKEQRAWKSHAKLFGTIIDFVNEDITD